MQNLFLAPSRRSPKPLISLAHPLSIPPGLFSIKQNHISSDTVGNGKFHRFTIESWKILFMTIGREISLSATERSKDRAGGSMVTTL